MLDVCDLSVQYGSLSVVKHISFTLLENRWLMLVGPNGAGKSTLVNALSCGAPHTGSVHLGGLNMAKIKPAELAKKVGVLSQTRSVAYSFTVGEIVRLGRYAHTRGLFPTQSDEDEEQVRLALELTGMKNLEHQSVLTLSGGELQRTFLAQVFAQNPSLLLLDEPTNHLDLVYQKQVFELIGEWIKQPGRAVISVVHDLSLARAHGTDVLLLHAGQAVAQGPADKVLSRENLLAVYGMDVHAWMRQMLSQWENSF